MTLKTALANEVANTAEIVALQSTRFYPGTVPLLASKPYSVFEILDEETITHLSGVSTLHSALGS